MNPSPKPPGIVWPTRRGGKTGGPPEETERLRRIIQNLYEALAFYADHRTYQNILIHPERNAGPLSDDHNYRPGFDGPKHVGGKARNTRPRYGRRARETFAYIKLKYGPITDYVRVKEVEDDDEKD